MSDRLRSLSEYELYLYSLVHGHASVTGSSLVLERRGATLARVSGELQFRHEVRLVVRERIVVDRTPGTIDPYGDEVWRGSEELYWYDSQPHPHGESLRATHPHHKHVSPDPKHNGVPAPQLSFDEPNLRVLIAEIEGLLAGLDAAS